MLDSSKIQQFADIAILIPTINESTLEEVVRAARSEMPGAEIVITGFGDARFIADKYQGTFLDLKEKTRKSIALNRAIQSTKKNKFIVLDADAIPQKGWGEAMQQELDCNRLFTCRVDISCGNYWMRAYNLSMLHTFATQKKNETAEYIPLFCTGFTREVYERIGPISDYLDRGQDYEWSLRARLLGVSPAYLPLPVVQHKPILKTTLKDLWNYWVETGKANLQIRLMYPQIVKTPRILLSPYFLLFFLPVLAMIASLRIISQSTKVVLQNIDLLPAVFLSKIAYCVGFFQFALTRSAKGRYD